MLKTSVLWKAHGSGPEFRFRWLGVVVSFKAFIYIHYPRDFSPYFVSKLSNHFHNAYIYG